MRHVQRGLVVDDHRLGELHVTFGNILFADGLRQAAGRRPANEFLNLTPILGRDLAHFALFGGLGFHEAFNYIQHADLECLVMNDPAR